MDSPDTKPHLATDISLVPPLVTIVQGQAALLVAVWLAVSWSMRQSAVQKIITALTGFTADKIAGLIVSTSKQCFAGTNPETTCQLPLALIIAVWGAVTVAVGIGYLCSAIISNARQPVTKAIERRWILVRISGIPSSSKGPRRQRAFSRWTLDVIRQTRDLPRVTGPSRLEVKFLLPPDRFPPQQPFGPDLDNLLKRLLDALNRTVLRDVAGRDSAIVEIVATKCKDATGAGSGAELKITPFYMPMSD